MEQKTSKNTDRQYITTKMRLDALRKIDQELENLYALNKLDSEVVESLSKLSEIEGSIQNLIYANSILNYMKIAKQN